VVPRLFALVLVDAVGADAEEQVPCQLADPERERGFRGGLLAFAHARDDIPPLAPGLLKPTPKGVFMAKRDDDLTRTQPGGGSGDEGGIGGAEDIRGIANDEDEDFDEDDEDLDDLDDDEEEEGL
jgi:hypothetical protein